MSAPLPPNTSDRVVWIVWSTTQGPIQAFESKADADELAASLGSQWIRVNCVGLAAERAE